MRSYDMTVYDGLAGTRYWPKMRSAAKIHPYTPIIWNAVCSIPVFELDTVNIDWRICINFCLVRGATRRAMPVS